jgi:uncharacterized membrane protein
VLEQNEILRWAMSEQTMTLAAITFSDVMVTVHILAVVVAFGGALAYPIWFRMIRNGTPEQRAFFHRAQDTLGKFLITPGIVVVFATGAYLTSDQDVWGEGWVLISTAMLVVILVIGAGLLGPSEGRLTHVLPRRPRDCRDPDDGCAGARVG